MEIRVINQNLNITVAQMFVVNEFLQSLNRTGCQWQLSTESLSVTSIAVENTADPRLDQWGVCLDLNFTCQHSTLK